MLGFLFKSFKEKAKDADFLNHLNVLRIYIIRSIVAVFVLSCTAFFFKQFIFEGIVLAPAKVDFPTYRFLCYLGHIVSVPELCVKEIPLNLTNIELGGQFRYHLILSFVSGLIVAFPFVAWQFWLFIKPALHANERRKTRGMVFYMSSLFLMGVSFGYYVITPLTVNFLASYELSAMIENHITISSYISNVTTLTFVLGLVFELPILIYFLTRIGLLTPQFLKKNRRWVFIIVLIAAGFITPSTDMFTQLLVAMPLYMLFEFSLIVSKRSVR